MTPKLSEGNFVQQAMHAYDNPQCVSLVEFEDDLKRFLYLKKLFTRYAVNGELRERLILNHIIVLFNVFGDSATKMLFFKTEEKHWGILATFLAYLGRLPDSIPDSDRMISELKIDENVVKVLRKI